MKKKLTLLFILLFGVLIGVSIRHNNTTWATIKKPLINYINSSNIFWTQEFKLIEISSSFDSSKQKAYVYKSNSKTPKALIVSLHTWGGDYSQEDKLALICKQNDLNYIHPNFRGTNNTKNSCCSEQVLSDIDDAISFAISNFNVDTSKIYVVGESGGGYATISIFMKSKHKIKKYSAWVPITDLIAWHNEGKIRKSPFVNDILNCTSSTHELNIKNAKQKSPIYWDTPIEKLNDAEVSIYAGIFDGIQGSVPITHSINIYNKILKDLSVQDRVNYVTASEKLKLLEFRKPLGNFGNIGGRKVYLKKEFKNLSLVLFEGGHEILTEFAFNQLIND